MARFQFRVVWEDSREPLSAWVDQGVDAMHNLLPLLAPEGRALERRSVGKPELVFFGDGDTFGEVTGTPYDVVSTDESTHEPQTGAPAHPSDSETSA